MTTFVVEDSRIINGEKQDTEQRFFTSFADAVDDAVCSFNSLSAYDQERASFFVGDAHEDEIERDGNGNPEWTDSIGYSISIEIDNSIDRVEFYLGKLDPDCEIDTDEIKAMETEGKELRISSVYDLDLEAYEREILCNCCVEAEETWQRDCNKPCRCYLIKEVK